jgi:predicted NUDIX family NTP pyrophosphohydrolase
MLLVGKRIGTREVLEMAKKSAGLLMYRFRDGNPEVFLVHMGGPYWAKKDLGAWSIPKGEYESGEDPFEAAKREFLEETGFAAIGEFFRLKDVKQPSGKLISAWAFEGDCDAKEIRSNTFSMEWPPRSGQFQEVAEIDRAEWFDPDTAREKILKGQRPFIEELQSVLQCENRATLHQKKTVVMDE